MISSGKLTVDTAAFVRRTENSGSKPLYEQTPEQARQILRDVQNVPVKMFPAAVDDMELPAGNGQKIRVRVVRPREKEDKILPVIFYIHGGGWIMGDRQTHERLIRELATKTEAAVVFPEYTPAPDAAYPTQINQLFAVLQYIVKEAANFKFDTGRLVVAGDSVGGNMATVMALMAKENNGPKIIFQLLLYPVTNADFDTESYHLFADGPWLTRKAMQWFWEAYTKNETQRREITASPLLTEVEHLEGMPPALIITAENDVLRDEGEAYARKLIQAGVEVSSVRINHTIHDFMMLNPLAASKPTRTAVNLVVGVLRRLFQKAKA